MAQLKDDCFAFGGELMPVTDALALLRERVTMVVDPEIVALRSALGRILSADIIADRSVPPHDNSAVDGYAVFFEDLNADGDTRIPVTGRVAAGHPLDRPARRREAVRIFTGAPMPDGMETVFMEEDCEADGNDVILPAGLKQGANRRKKGEDIEQGSVILKAGQRLRPQELGLAASVGFQELKVMGTLRVAVFSTGDEVCDPSDQAPEGSIFDANRYSVMSMLEGMSCHVTDLGILPDDEETIAVAIGGAAKDHHVIVTSGGVSAGEEDHVKAAVERHGSVDFWRLAIKPGRPIALGRIGDAAFIGLPGNPVAAMVTFMVIARSVLLMLMGASETAAPRYAVTADFDYQKKTGRREWLRAILSETAAAELSVKKFRSSGAGILTSMVAADGLVELPEDIESVAPGDVVQFLPFNEVSG
ncbi:MAG: molybdopterin molybdotransferase MoeA [Alphaproteobacteria bacterium]|nr:molybdopterin molybdotransferase MoeA [Alphaproteobacteria bacterium]